MDNIKDIYGHITDRIQKITAALYRVTDLLSDKEPIKWTLRNTAIMLYDNLVSIKNVKDKNTSLGDSLNLIYQIVKSLELVAAGTCVSMLNFEILKREYLALSAFMEGKKAEVAREQPILLEFPVYRNKTASLTSFKNQTFSETTQTPSISSKPPDLWESDLKNRKGKILDFLKNGAAKTVNEIAAILKGEASEKSVQRDLFDLVRVGKIIAVGDKRWRKYEVLMNYETSLGNAENKS